MFSVGTMTQTNAILLQMGDGRETAGRRIGASEITRKKGLLCFFTGGFGDCFLLWLIRNYRFARLRRIIGRRITAAEPVKRSRIYPFRPEMSPVLGVPATVLLPEEVRPVFGVLPPEEVRPVFGVLPPEDDELPPVGEGVSDLR